MADAKITALTENTSPLVTDIMPMVDDPAGTPVTQKMTFQSLINLLAATSPIGLASMSRQAVLNGNFDVWQRGTSFAFTTTNNYTADRWYADSATAGDDKTISRQTSDVTGSYYSCRVQRVSGETGHTVIRLSQALESQDSIKLRGQKLTLSFYMKVGANFSATSNVFTAKIVTGKGTDQKLTAFTTSADAASVDITATTSSVKYTLTTSAVIAADITQIGVSFSWDPTGTASTNDWFEVTQVQLCVGDVALPFIPKSFADTFKDCERFYEKSYDYATAPATDISASNAGLIVTGFTGHATSNGRVTPTIYRTRKRSAVSPTLYDRLGAVTKISTLDAADSAWTNGATATGSSGISETGFYIYLNASTVGGLAYEFTADAEF